MLMLNSNAFNKIWEKGILPLIRFYCEKITNLKLRKSEEEIYSEIWKNYQDFNNQCRSFMKSDVERLDRHKVTACYIFSIIKSEIFDYDYSIKSDKIYVVKEQLAISIGLKILQYFITSEYGRDNKKKSPEEYKRDLKIFKNGFIFPEEYDIGHGKYRNNFAIELYYTYQNENYNILSLSHSLYLLELYNRKMWELNNK